MFTHLAIDLLVKCVEIYICILKVVGDSMYKIVTDSCCDLPLEVMTEKDIAFISIEVILRQKTYLDDYGQSFGMAQFYQALKEGEFPMTSQINAMRYEDFFRQYVEQDLDVLYLCFSSAMSGCYQSALLAVENLEKEFPEVQITVVDTLSASGGQGLMVLDAVYNQTTGMSLEENFDWLEEHKATYDLWVVFNDLNHLYRGGRLNRSSAIIGEVLKVKPILSINEEGQLRMSTKVRTQKKALRFIANKVINTMQASPQGETQTVVIAHSGDFETAKQLEALILEQAQPQEIIFCEIGPTIASHTGLGCVGAFLRQTEC